MILLRIDWLSSKRLLGHLTEVIKSLYRYIPIIIHNEDTGTEIPAMAEKVPYISTLQFANVQLAPSSDDFSRTFTSFIIWDMVAYFFSCFKKN